jgi:hypothetical protein
VCILFLSVAAVILNLPRSTYIRSCAYSPILVQGAFADRNVYDVTLSSVHAQGPQATLTISHLDELTVNAIRDAMPVSPVRPVTIARTSSEAPYREKILPYAPAPAPAPAPAAPVTRTVSEPVTYLSMRGPPNFVDPAMRTELREAARRASEAEERAAVREEAARQARIKWLREEEARKAAEEEEERRAQLQRDLAHSAAMRMAREEEERAEEERRERERAERRQRDAERRAEVARKLEEQRLAEVRRLEDLARAEEELKRKAMERRDAARFVGAKRRRESRLAGESLLLSGWVTVQNSGSVAWRRRYFQLTDTLIRFYTKEKVSSFADRSLGADSKWQAGYHWRPT